MTEILLQWLNEEIKLSKKITDIPSDFSTGYYFAELLYKTNHLPVLSVYKNSSKKIDVLHNLDYLQKNFNGIGILLDEKSKNKIINNDIYTAKIYLYKIKQLLSNKNINLEQLHFKNSMTLSKLYNSIYLKNENEKYLSRMHRLPINERGLTNYKYMRQYNKDKYSEVYKQIKKEYAHLGLNEKDMELIMADIKDTEYRMNHFKNYVNKSEERQRKLNQLKSDKEFKIWFNSKTHMDNLKNKVITKSLNKLGHKKKIFTSYMKNEGIFLQKASNAFEDKLTLFLEPKRNQTNNESNEEVDDDEENEKEKRIREMKISQVILANIRNKLDENIKNKRDKEKRERQKLRDETFNIKKGPYHPNNLNLNIHIKDSNYKDILEEKDNENEKALLTKTITSKISTYSRLTKGDFFTNLIDSSFKIHRGNIKIGNRINFFKTVNVRENDNEKQKLKLPEIEIKERKKGFNEKEFFEELNKEHFDEFNKNFTKRKIKKEKKNKQIKPIVEYMIDIVNYVYDHQHKINYELIDDNIWKDIGDKFKQNIILNESEEDEILMKQIEESRKKTEEEENKQSTVTTTNIDMDIFNDLFTDYLNYTGLFNDIIIPHDLRNRKFTYIDLYSEFYNSNINNIDLKEYEPSETEIENLSLPKYIKRDNEFLNDILTEILEYKDEDITLLKKELKTENEKSKEEKIKEYVIKNKGKYCYIPIKMAFIGYPCSGKKTQGHLLIEKYPNLKIYNPEEMLKNKISEYKELYETDIEHSNPKFKNMKPAQLEQYKQELEEKKEKFKPILDIIQPYLSIISNSENTSEKNETQINNEKEILSSIYMKLLIEELNKDFSGSEEELYNKLSERKEKYLNYSQIWEKYSKNKQKLEEIEKELNEIQEQKDKLPHKKELTTSQTNINKEQDVLIKDLNSLKANLFSGFIIINFPQTKKEALELEKYFTGFELEYKKEESIVTQKLKKYNIINLNYERNNCNKDFPLISFFDLFVNFNIDPNEINERYNNVKYDPTTNKTYSSEEITKINDKKLLERLIKGVPNLDEKEFEQKKINYENNIYEISDFYKKMKNGVGDVYINLNQKDEDKKLLKEVNSILENSLEDVIIQNFYENIDLVMNELKINIHNEEEKEKDKEKDKDKENEKNNNPMNNSNIENKMNESNELHSNNAFSHIEENIINIKEDSKKQIDSTYSTYQEIISNLDSFYTQYNLSIKSLIYLMSNQRKRMILYLNKIQDDFIKYLNRNPEKNDIIPVYIDKYNKIMNLNSRLTKNQKVYDELMEDISSVNNSIWVNVQMKKKDDIDYLEKVKNRNEKEKYLNQFMNIILKLYEAEIEKYLLHNEVVIKFFLNKVGLLSNITGIFEKSKDQFMFKIDYKKYLYKNEVNNDTNYNFNHHTTYYSTNTELYNTLSTNETQFNFSKNDNDFNDIQKELKKIFENSLKIIIRQEKLNENYIEKIKSITNKLDKDNKSYIKYSNSKDNSHKNNKKGINASMSPYNTNNNFSVLTSKSTIFKNKVKTLGNKLLNRNEEIPTEEAIRLNLTQEKNSLRYRLMFLNSFILKYIKLINECFTSVYYNMDEWIKINLETQNNKLNEFITYLKRALDKNFESISMEGREFNYNDKYAKNKKFVLPLYKNLYPDEIINLNIKFSPGSNFEDNLVKLSSLNLIQQYVYNLNDLNELYYLLKEYGIQTCEYFVKYEIVKNIFINKVIDDKDLEYFLFYRNNNKSAKESHEKNYKEVKIFNGVCKRMKFYSTEKIDNFIRIFLVYENKYININTLFTTLLIIGSELISSEKFYEQINSYIPEKKKNKTHLLLTLEEFMKINFWFENDHYLNEISDINEENRFQGKYNSSYSINQVNDGTKRKNTINETFFNHGGTSTSIRKNYEFRKSSEKIEKNKKINKIKELIFDINKNNDGLFDINLIGQLLDLLNNYCKKKKEIKNEIEKKDKNLIDIDEQDKCFRFSSDDSDEYIYMNKNFHPKHSTTIIAHAINNIFNNIFEN